MRESNFAIHRGNKMNKKDYIKSLVEANFTKEMAEEYADLLPWNEDGSFNFLSKNEAVKDFGQENKN